MTSYDGKTPILSDEEMRELGFTDHVETRWYLCRRVDKRGDTTLNITIEKDSGLYTELVMNEGFGQPEYYGNMKPEWRDLYRDTIDLELALLNKAGLTITVDHKAYGCKD
jgi:hypothetical protein